MRHTDGVKRNCCPACGGEIVISWLYQYSFDHKILKSGHMSKKYKRHDCGPMEVAIASCENCGANWDEGEFMFADECFVDLKYTEDNRNV